MPRAARVKSHDSVYHVMVRSINDVPLYKEDKDKDYFLNLIKGYQEQLGFKVYAYCLMTTHGHMILYANGADISKVMHGINQRYAQYFNKKYKRHGHVFSDRFKSIIVSDDRYLITLSAYIHNNPKDMKRYKSHVEDYKYSTLGVYMGLRKDPMGIVDEDFIMGLFSENTQRAREMYLKMVYAANNQAVSDTLEFKNEKSQYRSEKVVLVRNFTSEDILDFVARYAGVEKKLLKAKHRRDATEARALCVFLMRYLCDYTHRDICRALGYVTISRVSSLCYMGADMVYRGERHGDILQRFIEERGA